MVYLLIPNMVNDKAKHCINLFVLQESGNLLGGLSGCDELLGATHRR